MPKTTEVTVAAKKDSFRRIGREFSAEPVIIEVTEAELEVLQAEPLLVVTMGKATKKEVPVITTKAFSLSIDEASPVIAKAPSIEAVEAFTAGDGREGIKKAAAARTAELTKD